MIETMKGVIAVLRPLGREATMRILDAAWSRLTLEEQAAIGIVLEHEEQVLADWVARCLRQAKTLPPAIRRLLKAASKP